MSGALNLVVLGYGYSAQALVRHHGALFARVDVTVRSPAGVLTVGHGIRGHAWSGGAPSRELADAIRAADVLLATAAPDEAGDPFLDAFAQEIAAAPRLGLLQYLSTVGVYGDHGGAWVDETAETRPASLRSQQRLVAENAWFDLAAEAGKAVQVHRLAGIYGPGRNALVDLRAGTARRIDKPGQVFNRIHVEDIAGALAAGIGAGRTGAFNICDDLPAPAPDVVAHAAALLGMTPPPLVRFEEAQLSEMARSFYGESKRCSNARAKAELGFRPRFPDYRAGLDALFAAGEGKA